MSSGTTRATGLSGRYATALFELADADKQLDQVAEDLGALAEMIRDSADLMRLIRSPVMSRSDQGRAMEALLQKAEFSELTRRFIGVVAGNRRLFVLPDMISDYLNLLAAQRGETTAEVVSAKELTKKQLDSLSAVLKKALGTKVSVDTKVDAGLLGGLVVKVGSRMVDSSLRTKLQRLRLVMRGVG